MTKVSLENGKRYAIVATATGVVRNMVVTPPVVGGSKDEKDENKNRTSYEMIPNHVAIPVEGGSAMIGRNVSDFPSLAAAYEEKTKDLPKDESGKIVIEALAPAKSTVLSKTSTRSTTSSTSDQAETTEQDKG